MNRKERRREGEQKREKERGLTEKREGERVNRKERSREGELKREKERG